MGRLIKSVLAIGVAVLALPALAVAQEGATVSGRVTNESGAPLNSASVFLEGMGIGTLSKEDGRYTFVVPAARVKGQQVTISARLIGFKQKSVTVALSAGAMTQDFVLETNPLKLGEVVVTGNGTSSTREKLGVAINSVDSTAITNSHQTNIVNAFQGKAPNVIVNNQAGDPGASSNINIRGLRSLTASSQPLFVVDGTPIDNSTLPTPGLSPGVGGTVAPNRASDLNPDDIESVDILKGPAAAAIYGAAGSNGAILITTKSGKSGATRFSFNSTIQVNEVTNAIPLQTDYGQGSIFATKSQNLCLTAPTLGCSAMSQSYGAQLATGTTTYDHWGDLFRTGDSWINNLSLTGGNDKTTYYLGIGYMNQQGTITGPNNWYDQANVRVKASQRLADRVVVSGNIAYIDTKGEFVQRGSNTSGLELGSLRTPPEFNNLPYLDSASGLHRSFRYPHPTSSSQLIGRGYDNPFFVLNEDPAQSELNRVVGTIGIQWDINDWLKLTDNMGGDYYNDQRLEGVAQTSSAFSKGQITTGNFSVYNLDNFLNLQGQKTFNPNFSGTLTLGTEISSNRYSQNMVVGQQLLAPTPFSLANTQVFVPNEYNSLTHTLSYYVRATADMFNQLYVTVGARRDGYSTFGASEPWAWYPHANAAWTFTNALGNTDQKGLLSYGKLRVAYGETGTPPQVYATQTVLNPGSQFGFGSGFGDVLLASQPGFGGLFSNNNLGNANLMPERQKEFEAGADLGFFDQKADLGITWYQERSTQVIQALPIPPSTGFNGALSNQAKINNDGFEVTANYRPVTNANTSMEFGVTWGQNFTKAIYLGGAQFYGIGGGTFAGAAGTMYLNQGLVLQGNDFERCGISTDTAITAGCVGAPKGAMYIDASGFPIADPNASVIANPTPSWVGGIHGNLRFQKLTVNFQVDHKQGGQVWNGTQGALQYFGTHKTTDNRNTMQVFGSPSFHPGVVAGPGAGTPVLIDQNWYDGDGSSFVGPGAQNVEDGTYTKLREIGLQYTLDGRWVTHNLGLSSMDVRIAGRNLYTWTNYTGNDPETNLAGAAVTYQGVDYFNSPQTRSFIFSIGLNR